jgi:hypothetical protein
MAKAKQKRSLTHKQSRYIEARLKGRTKRQSMDAAGYSRNVKAQDIEGSLSVRAAFLAHLERAGVTDELLSRRLREGLDAADIRVITARDTER